MRELEELLFGRPAPPPSLLRPLPDLGQRPAQTLSCGAFQVTLHGGPRQPDRDPDLARAQSLAEAEP